MPNMLAQKVFNQSIIRFTVGKCVGQIESGEQVNLERFAIGFTALVCRVGVWSGRKEPPHPPSPLLHLHACFFRDTDPFYMRDGKHIILEFLTPHRRLLHWMLVETFFMASLESTVCLLHFISCCRIRGSFGSRGINTIETVQVTVCINLDLASSTSISHNIMTT